MSFVTNFGFGFGVSFENRFGNVIISSFTKNLHLFERLTSATRTVATNFAGGCYVWEYTTNLGTSYTPSPFFTIPGGSSQYVGISRVFESGGRWKVELISNENNRPQLYIFTEAAGAPSYGDYGFSVRDRNGDTTFDSTKAPLVVSGEYDAFNMDPTPSTPSSSGLAARDGGSNGNAKMSSTFTPTGVTNLSRSNALPSKPIYQYFSTPQAQTSVTVTERQEDCNGIDLPKIGCTGVFVNEFWVSRYWAYYRTGINGSKCKWITRQSDAAYNYDKSESPQLVGVDFDPLGAISSLLNLEDGGYSGGLWPYENESLNLNQPPIIFADGERYDQLL